MIFWILLGVWLVLTLIVSLFVSDSNGAGVFGIGLVVMLIYTLFASMATGISTNNIRLDVDEEFVIVELTLADNGTSILELEDGRRLVYNGRFVATSKEQPFVSIKVGERLGGKWVPWNQDYSATVAHLPSTTIQFGNE